MHDVGMHAGDGAPPNHHYIWMSALCQSLTTLVADFVSLACDWKFHSIDYFTHWVTDMRTFLVYILIIVTLGASRWHCEARNDPKILCCKGCACSSGKLKHD